MGEVYERGLLMGNDPTRFSKVGDCQNVSTLFLSTFDQPGEFRLGSDYTYLQPTIDQFRGSWSRESLAIKPGFNVASVLSPLRADPEACEPAESPLACELRVWKPSFVIVSLETWWGEQPALVYKTYMRQVVEYILSQGAVPILATKADNLEGDDSINAAIAEVANEYDVPLWNYWAAVQPLPDKGLWDDGFHLTYALNYFDAGTNEECLAMAQPDRPTGDRLSEPQPPRALKLPKSWSPRKSYHREMNARRNHHPSRPLHRHTNPQAAHSRHPWRRAAPDQRAGRFLQPDGPGPVRGRHFRGTD
jgi:hypothetical protein